MVFIYFAGEGDRNQNPMEDRHNPLDVRQLLQTVWFSICQVSPTPLLENDAGECPRMGADEEGHGERHHQIHRR